MKAVICIILFLGTTGQQSFLYQDDKPKSIEEQTYNIYLLVGECLIKDKRITISKEKFARYCTIIAWCESGINPKANYKGQQGIMQMTRNTRRLLHLPKNITAKCLEMQIWYHYMFFLECGKSLKRAKTVQDLHMVNFKPFGSRTYIVQGRHDLDLNKDGLVNVIDLKRFQIRQSKYNPIISDMLRQSE